MFDLIAALPIASALAVVFYGLVVAFVFLPGFQARADSWLSMPTPSTKESISPLDSLPGLAALMIAVFHTWQWSAPMYTPLYDLLPFLSRGAKAVPIFVALSGFLIYRSLLRVRHLEQLRRYALRRFLRIYPAYAVTLLAALAVGLFDGRTPVFQHLLAEFTMVRMFGFDGLANPPLWSLYVEVLFYLVAPVFVVLITPLNRRSRIAIFIAAALGLLLVDFAGPRELALWKYFFFGFLASELTDVWRDRASERMSVVLFFVGFVLLVLDLGFGEIWFSNLMNAIFTKNGLPLIMPRGGGANPDFTFGLGVAAMFLIVGVSLSNGKLCQSLSARPLRYLGVVSYSVFLWHSIVIMADLGDAGMAFSAQGLLMSGPNLGHAPIWFLPLVMVPAILTVSIASFVLIERPFLHLRPGTYEPPSERQP